MSYILVFDQGTTGSQAALYELATLREVARSKVEFPQHYPAEGWVEHCADEIWQSCNQALEDCLKDGNFNPNEIRAIGITNQRETVVAWNKETSELAGKAIVWQDRRTASRCEELRANEQLSTEIRLKTGLLCDPYFSGTKIEWLLQNNQNCKDWAVKGELAFGTIDSFLIWKLSAGHSFVTDHSNASRTLLYNLEQADFDAELMELFSVKRSMLPKLQSSISEFGQTKSHPVLPDGIPITGCLGDQQAALFGQNCEAAGRAKTTLGTGAFLLRSTGAELKPAPEGLLSTVACSAGGERSFAFEGSVFVAGALVQFLRDKFCWFEDSSETEQLALSRDGAEELFFVPAMTGLGAPYWNPNAKAALLGMTLDTDKAQVIRAALEAIALQNWDLLNAMEDSSSELAMLAVDGGASKNNCICQFLANCLQIDIFRPEDPETTSRGAARAARIGLGESDIENTSTEGRIFRPDVSAAEAKALQTGWKRACEAVNQFYRS